MKYLTFFVVLISALVLYFFSIEPATKSAIDSTPNISVLNPGNDQEFGSKKPNFSQVNSVDSISDLAPVDVDEVFDRGKGVSYKSIDELDYDSKLLEQVREDLDNFRKFGSVGKGVATIEFGSTSDLARSLDQKGLNSILNGLAFDPVHLTNILGSNYHLVGADDQGKLIPGRGWNGYLQYVSGSGGRQVELSESQIETKLGDGTDVIKEFLNEKIDNVPASVQVMKDGSGNAVFSIQWSDADRLFTLNAKNFERGDAMKLAEQVLARYRLLPNQGWKTPYILDPNNPFHRLAIQRDQQRLTK